MEKIHTTALFFETESGTMQHVLPTITQRKSKHEINPTPSKKAQYDVGKPSNKIQENINIRVRFNANLRW